MSNGNIADTSVVASVHESGLTLLHLREGLIFVANRAGACVWQALERGVAVETIAEEMSRQFQVPLVTTRADTARFVAALEQHRLFRTR